MLHRLFLATVVCAALIAAGAAGAEKLTKSKYRKLKRGVGNCVFSTQPLPFEKEDSYEVKKDFTSGDVVHARCYFGKQLQSFKKKGKLKNELRDENIYRARVDFEPADKKLKKKLKRADKTKKKKASSEDAVAPVSFPKAIKRLSADGSDEWDQRDYRLDPSHHRCLFPALDGESKCLDFDRAVKAYAKQLEQPLPFAAQVCMTTFVPYVDKTKKKGEAEAEDVVKEDVLAEDCFTWTAKASEAPAADAAKGEK
jgi:hypothetical protein